MNRDTFRGLICGFLICALLTGIPVSADTGTTLSDRIVTAITGNNTALGTLNSKMDNLITAVKKETVEYAESAGTAETATTAASVPWSGITGIPSSVTNGSGIQGYKISPVSISYNLGTNDYQFRGSKSITISGYTPVAIASYEIQHYMVRPLKLIISGNTLDYMFEFTRNYQYNQMNVGNPTDISGSITVNILYFKN